MSVLCLYSLCFSISNFSNSITLKPDEINVFSSEKINSVNIYEFKNVNVIDCYHISKYDNSNPDSYNFLLMCHKNGKSYTFSMAVNEKDGEILEKMLELTDEDERNQLSFYARINKFRTHNDDLYLIYLNAANNCCESYKNAEISDLLLDYCFYDSSQLGTFTEKEKANLENAIKVDIVFMTIGIILIVLGAFVCRPTKKHQKKMRKNPKTKNECDTDFCVCSENDDRFNYIFSNEYFQKSSDDY